MNSRSSRKHSRKHRDSDRERDKNHRSKYRDTDGENCRRRSERERSENIDVRVKREKSYDRETSTDRELREKSVDNRRRHHHHKRKHRNDDIDDEDKKRSRVLDERKKRKRFEYNVAAAEDDIDIEKRKQRRKLEDKLNKEEIDLDNCLVIDSNGDHKLKSEVKDELFGGALESHNKTLRETSVAPSHPPPSKVSSISSKHENKGVNSNRSHEVPSADAISKAKATLLKSLQNMKMLNKLGINAKAHVLRLDRFGREVDEHGNVQVNNIPKLNNLSTLKVNINKNKKDYAAFKISKPELEVGPAKNPHFDPRMGIDKVKLLRPKKTTFQFIEEGTWVKEAEMLKLKSQFGEAQARDLKAKQAQLAKAKAEPDINPNLIEVSNRIVIIEEEPKDPIPDVEWWDVPLLESGSYGNIVLKKGKVTLYVEHPHPIEPPAEPAPPPPQPLKLTQKERKKLRTQRRLATEQNRQELIRQGLLEPPKPKVKMSNLMRVVGSEATQDPTRLEMKIRSAAAEREQAHVDRNIARKLTPAERREKKERKLFDDNNNTLETIVSVYKVNDLSHPQTRSKVYVNAEQNRLSGCAVMLSKGGVCVVVVEGGNKSIRRYQKLMLKRINWAAAPVKQENEDDEDHDDEKTMNKCVLVWQGTVAKPSFHRFSVHDCRTEIAARKVFTDAGVAHYWDLAFAI
ncbi:protein RDM16-like [Rutidosis leptorrhynchoides]|uniref:protein RDM16-like n=1 Tax=Rutidosis leptorrhynchoides TaxID=125765 RepID=UPI003A997573